jgi:hypothetical protein
MWSALTCQRFGRRDLSHLLKKSGDRSPHAKQNPTYHNTRWHSSTKLTPTSRAKPGGALGCEIWVKVDGPPPTDPSELKYLATDTRSPYLAEYDGAQAAKIAYYMLRWASTRGEQGPWSQTVSATITA